MRKAIVDVDDTLWPFWETAIQFMPELPAYYLPPNWYLWREDFGITKERWQEVIDKTHAVQATSAPYWGVDQLFATLVNMDYQVIVASHRAPHQAASLAEWMRVQRMQSYTGLYSGPDKLFLLEPGDILIDDNPHTCIIAKDSWGGKVSVLAPEKTWNRILRDYDIPRVSNLHEAVVWLTELSMKE